MLGYCPLIPGGVVIVVTRWLTLLMLLLLLLLVVPPHTVTAQSTNWNVYDAFLGHSTYTSLEYQPPQTNDPIKIGSTSVPTTETTMREVVLPTSASSKTTTPKLKSREDKDTTNGSGNNFYERPKKSFHRVGKKLSSCVHNCSIRKGDNIRTIDLTINSETQPRTIHYNNDNTKNISTTTKSSSKQSHNEAMQSSKGDNAKTKTIPNKKSSNATKTNMSSIPKTYGNMKAYNRKGTLLPSPPSQISRSTVLPRSNILETSRSDEPANRSDAPSDAPSLFPSNYGSSSIRNDNVGTGRIAPGSNGIDSMDFYPKKKDKKGKINARTYAPSQLSSVPKDWNESKGENKRKKSKTTPSSSQEIPEWLQHLFQPPSPSIKEDTNKYSKGSDMSKNSNKENKKSNSSKGNKKSLDNDDDDVYNFDDWITFNLTKSDDPTKINKKKGKATSEAPSSYNGKGKGRGKNKDVGKDMGRNKNKGKGKGKGAATEKPSTGEPSKFPETQRPTIVVPTFVPTPTNIAITNVPTISPVTTETSIPSSTATSLYPSTDIPLSTMPTTTLPTAIPTSVKTTNDPTNMPTLDATPIPTSMMPTAPVTESPTISPTVADTKSPTISPSVADTESPSLSPTVADTDSPTISPTVADTEFPTISPTVADTESPIRSPTVLPTQNTESAQPDITDMPTISPAPSRTPTIRKTKQPTILVAPTVTPTIASTSATPTIIEENRIVASPFNVIYFVGGGATDENLIAGGNVTLEYLEDYLVTQFAFNPATELLLSTGAIIETDISTTSTSFSLSLLFANGSQLVPSQADVDRLIVTAFQQPFVSELLTLLRGSLPVTNPLSTTTGVTYSQVR